jgi:hypothetical protein
MKKIRMQVSNNNLVEHNIIIICGKMYAALSIVCFYENCHSWNETTIYVAKTNNLFQTQLQLQQNTL